MSNIISHPRLIEQKEKELEEYEKQITIKRNALVRDYQLLALRNSTLDNTGKRRAMEILMAFVTGVICCAATLMFFG
jgi:hypothetical protein